jgi:channel protein (hemolysin III family)
VGATATLGLGIHLVRQARGLSNRLALGAFALSAFFLLSMSGVYHMLSPGPAREAVRSLDHAAIWALIAGTFTPIHVILFRGVWRWGLLGLVWVGAITGMVLKSLYFNQLPEGLWLVFYLALGWLGLASCFQVARGPQRRHLRFMAMGGLAYTIGAICEWLQLAFVAPGVIGPHEIFHLAVLAGLAYHWTFIQRAALAATIPEAAGGMPLAAAPA